MPPESKLRYAEYRIRTVHIFHFLFYIAGKYGHQSKVVPHGGSVDKVAIGTGLVQVTGMKNEKILPLQYLIDNGIGARLINGSARQRLRTIEGIERIDLTQADLTGDVFKDTVSLGAAALLRHVNQLLQSDPLRVISSQNGVLLIRVFGAMDYVIDRIGHVIWVEPSPWTPREKASKTKPPWRHRHTSRETNIDLLNPLCRSSWLEHVATRPGWFAYTDRDGGHVDQLFVSCEMMDLALTDVADLVAERLKSSREMATLRHRLASTLSLHIGSEVVDIALRSRIITNRASLTAKHLNMVWCNLHLYQRMDQENPRLLVALTAWLSHFRNTNEAELTDAIPAMRSDVLASGLTPKAWRLLAAKGLKKLLPSQLNHSAWQTLISNLQALSASRWPALAPRGFLRLLHDSVGCPDSYDSAHAGVPGWFWQIVCNEAAVLKGHAPGYKELFDSVPRWAWLVRKYAFGPDKNQRRRGCEWLREAVKNHEYLEEIVEAEESQNWAPWIESAQLNITEKLTVVPLLSESALITESMAMHNCADKYVSRCLHGNELLLSLRDKATGRRIALASTVRRGRNWSLDEIAGPCNEPVQMSIRKYAKQAIAEVNRKYTQYLTEQESAACEPAFFEL